MSAHRRFLPLIAAFLAVNGCDLFSTETDPITHFGVNVTGVVRNAEDGQPIQGASVRAFESMDGWTDPPEVTNSLGQYRISYSVRAMCQPCEQHASGQCTTISIAVDHADYRPDSCVFEILCQGGQQTLPDIELVPSGG